MKKPLRRIFLIILCVLLIAFLPDVLILLAGGVLGAIDGYKANKKANEMANYKNEMANYKTAVEAGDFDKAYISLGYYHNGFMSSISEACSTDEEVLRDLKKRDYQTASSAYFDAFDYIYKAEIRVILTKMEGQDAADKIIFLLSEIPVDGKIYPQGDYEMNSTNSYKDEYYTFYNTYITWSQHFNGLCDAALMLAINRKNKDAAQQVLLHYADNLKVSHRNRTDHVEYVRTDALEAKKKYKEAESMGLFD